VRRAPQDGAATARLVDGATAGRRRDSRMLQHSGLHASGRRHDLLHRMAPRRHGRSTAQRRDGDGHDACVKMEATLRRGRRGSNDGVEEAGSLAIRHGAGVEVAEALAVERGGGGGWSAGGGVFSGRA
jgi:hypothetical protein